MDPMMAMMFGPPTMGGSMPGMGMMGPDPMEMMMLQELEQEMIMGGGGGGGGGMFVSALASRMGTLIRG